MRRASSGAVQAALLPAVESGSERGSTGARAPERTWTSAPWERSRDAGQQRSEHLLKLSFKELCERHRAYLDRCAIRQFPRPLRVRGAEARQGALTPTQWFIEKKMLPSSVFCLNSLSPRAPFYSGLLILEEGKKEFISSCRVFLPDLVDSIVQSSWICVKKSSMKSKTLKPPVIWNTQ